MAKLTLQSITAQFASIAKLNANFQAIATAVENTLSRDGTSPNAMGADLDMDSNKIINLPTAVTSTEPARFDQVQTLIANAGFDWRGAWTLATDYVANELVENDGQAYICILEHTAAAGNEPGVGASEATYWDLVSAKGDTGAKGDQGDPGNDGADGSDGLGFSDINAQTGTTYTFVLADANTELVTLSNGSAITATVPPNSSVAFPIGTSITFTQLGAGQVTIAEGSGVTVNVNADDTLKLTGQYATGSLIKIDTDTWVLMGRLELA